MGVLCSSTFQTCFYTPALQHSSAPGSPGQHGKEGRKEKQQRAVWQIAKGGCFFVRESQGHPDDPLTDTSKKHHPVTQVTPVSPICPSAPIAASFPTRCDSVGSPGPSRQLWGVEEVQDGSCPATGYKVQMAPWNHDLLPHGALSPHPADCSSKQPLSLSLTLT